MSTTDTLINDIYKVVQTKEVPEGVDLEEAIEHFGENCKRLMKNLFKEKRQGPTLRMSSVGKGDRYIYNAAKKLAQEKIPAHTHVKFMYGHLIEEMLIFLTRAAGHTVTHEQHEVEVEGIKGHIDCMIDGELVDIKSASTFAFKKFQNRTLVFDDPFGYIPQIQGYAHGMGVRKGAWLAMDKQNGYLTFLQYDFDDPNEPGHEILNRDITERCRHLKKVVGEPVRPSVCFEPIPDGKSGNMKLSSGCSYCGFKAHCWPNLRLFYYSSGPRWLTTVAREPDVAEGPVEVPTHDDASS